MRPLGVRLTAVFVAALAVRAASQGSISAARNLIADTRPLSAADVATVLAAARSAMAGKACGLAYVPNGPGPQVLMKADGRPRYVRSFSGFDFLSGNSSPSQAPQAGHVDVTTFTDYTGQPAKRCDGTPLGTELVIEYERRTPDAQWTVRARTRTALELAAPAFDILAGDIRAQSGNSGVVDGAPARAFVALWKPPPDAQPSGDAAGATQSLWIDTLSLLPVRWSIALPTSANPGTPAPEYALLFTYNRELDVRPPEGVTLPRCVP